MTLFSGLVDMVRRSTSPENPTVPLSSATLEDLWGHGLGTDSGITVNERTSLGMSAVFRAVSLTSAVAASVPMPVYRRDPGNPDARIRVDRDGIVRDPHPEMTGVEFWGLNYAHRMLWGNAYAFKVKAGNGQIVNLLPLLPDRMRVGRIKPSDGNPGGKIFAYQHPDLGEQVWTSNEVFHVPGFGYDGVCGVSRIRLARQAIGLGLAAEAFGARLFGHGSLVSGVLQTEQRLDLEDVDKLKAQWRAKMTGLGNAHDIAILDSGAEFKQLTMPNSDAQFLESRMFQVGEIERFMGVPPFLMMDTEKSTSWGTGLEQQTQGWVQFDLLPSWLKPTEQRVTKELLLDPNVFAEHRVEGLLRGDSLARAMFYRTMREIGAMSANDVRRKENEPPVEGGDTYLQPLNLGPLGYDPTTKGASK